MRCLALVLCQMVCAQSPYGDIRADKISGLLKAFMSGDRNRMVSQIRFPLPRPYPLPAIGSAGECLQRFDEVFDAAFLAELCHSDVHADWQRVGWRGISFKSGSLWLDDDYQVLAINHETDRTRALRASAIDAQKQSLPASLRDFEEPELEWTTARCLIRVDRKGDDYRLVVFDGHTRTKVLRELHHGRLRQEGTMGAYRIDWQEKGRTHRIYSGIDRSDDAYFIYGALVDPDDGPDAPVETHKRQSP